MAQSSFDSLPEEKFRKQMRPAALRIYQRLFPECELQDLRAEGVRVHVLDKEFAIDSLVVLPAGYYFTIQEKYRRNKYLHYAEFTQEYKNAVGTKFESPGEWFKLAAQLYFYGWANAEGTDFEKWVLLDVAKYKKIVTDAGGLAAIGQIKANTYCGSANFYAIPIKRLWPAVLTYHNSTTWR